VCVCVYIYTYTYTYTYTYKGEHATKEPTPRKKQVEVDDDGGWADVGDASDDQDGDGYAVTYVYACVRAKPLLLPVLLLLPDEKLVGPYRRTFVSYCLSADFFSYAALARSRSASTTLLLFALKNRPTSLY